MLRVNLWFGCFLDFKTYTCAEMYSNERKHTFIKMLLKLNINYNISFGFFFLLVNAEKRLIGFLLIGRRSLLCRTVVPR